MQQSVFENWLKNVNPLERVELEKIKEDKKEIKERFSLPLAFGTAGMRGEIGLGTFRMNTYTVKRATYGLAKFILSLGNEAMQKGVIISYDTRRFSLEFAITAAQVLSKAKIRSFIFEDVRPVPMCSFAIRELGTIAGIMITASHNPKEYNGYKVYGDDGAQMSPENTQNVVNFIEKIENPFTIPTDDIVINSIKGLDNQKLNEYITVIGKSIDEKYYTEIEKLALSPKEVAKYGHGIKLVYTPIHGAGYIPVTTILKRMGINATIVKQQALPDPDFSTVSTPNPENEDTLRMGIELGNKIGANVVIGTDPDSDRMGLAIRNPESKNFELLNGNQIGVLLLDYILTRLKEENNLPANGAVVKTIVTTSLADIITESYNLTVFNVLTGFKFIGEKIKEWESNHKHSYVFGFEESFGYLRGTHARDKDAVVACMLTAEMVCYYESKGKGIYDRLIEIFETYGYFYEENTSIVYKGVEGMHDMAAVMQSLREKTITQIADEKVLYTADYQNGIKLFPDGKKELILLPKTNALYYALEEKQFICIRPSGTEPKLKVYILCSSTSLENVKQKAKKLMDSIKKEL